MGWYYHFNRTPDFNEIVPFHQSNPPVISGRVYPMNVVFGIFVIIEYLKYYFLFIVLIDTE